MVDHAAGGGTSERIREAARGTAEQAKEQATHVVDQIREQAQSLVNEKKSAAADQINGIATALRKTVEELEGQNYSNVAGYVGRAASGLEEFSSTIRDRDLGTLFGDIEEMARRYPAAFLGTTVVAGFMFARFLKSSSTGVHAAMGGDDDSGDHPVSSPRRRGPRSGSARRSSPGQSRAGQGGDSQAGTAKVGTVKAHTGNGARGEQDFPRSCPPAGTPSRAPAARRTMLHSLARTRLAAVNRP